MVSLYHVFNTYLDIGIDLAVGTGEIPENKDNSILERSILLSTGGVA